jgi:hypothetical protein
MKQEKKNLKLREIELTQQEWWAAQRGSVEQNRKKYRRKPKNQDRWRRVVDEE